MDKVQRFEWGHIDWIYMPDSNPYTVMNIGTITVKPGCRQNKHVHYSDEQLLYVLSGEGIQILNEDKVSLKPGMIFHMDPGDMHETVNTGTEDLVELLISIPVDLDQDPNLERYRREEARQGDGVYDLKEHRESIEAFYNNLIKPLNVPVSVFDSSGILILGGEEFPEYCRKVCRIDEDLMNCELYRIRDEYKPPYYFEHTSYVCRYGITVLFIPIIHRQQIVGFIRGGHVREAERIIEVKTAYELPYERPKSSMNSLLRLMIRFQKSIQNHLMFVETHREIIEKESRIKSEMEQKSLLEESLKNTRSKMLSIQINNHFLFNTLSAIASLALEDGSLKTYDAIIHLSKMFRYSMNSHSKGVRLLDEIAYIEDYLKLQQLRFGDRLSYEIHIDRETMGAEVPFNFLQPIVENAFKHAFDEHLKVLDLQISCDRDDKWLRISVNDNGKGIGPDRLEVLRQRFDTKKGRLSGLMMVLMKLERLYGHDVKLDIETSPGVGTTMTVIIPKGQVTL